MFNQLLNRILAVFLQIFSFCLVPKKQIPLRKPGSENDPYAEELDDDEPKTPDTTSKPNNRDVDEKFKNAGKGYSMKTVIITFVPMVFFSIVILALIAYLLWQRVTRPEKYMEYASRQNVRTFSNPNYNASGADAGPCNPQQEKRFIWKRLKYDSSQVRQIFISILII